MDLNYSNFYTLINPRITQIKKFEKTVKINIEGMYLNKYYFQIIVIPNNPLIYSTKTKLLNFIRNHKEYIIKQIPQIKTMLIEEENIQPLTISRNLSMCTL